MAWPMPPRPMKPTVSSIGALSIDGRRGARRLAGALVRLPQPLGVLGRPIEPVRRLEPLESALGGCLSGPGAQVGRLLFRQRSEGLDRLQVLLVDLQAVNAGDDGRGRQGHRVVEALDGSRR